MRHALVVEDDRPALEALLAWVEQQGFSVHGETCLTEARRALQARPPQLLLVDLILPDGSGLELIDDAIAAGAQVVLITGNASVDTAVEALRHGATDYLTKPLDLARLTTILANVARTGELRAEIGSLRGALRKLGHFGPLIGASDAMGAVYDLIAKVAPTEATVLIVGESGSGKEVVTQAVHELSRRRHGPFVPVNCGAISPTLIETTLFGHEKGSFTGAEKMHRGLFEQAAEGTLFLDEVTEMPLELQVKFLRVLETGTATRIGGEKSFPVDVRVVAATNRDPEQAMRDGRLREDLWYRLNVFPIQLPPLRLRRGDIRLLARHFLAELNASNDTAKHWSDAALARLDAYDWPGNVRELKNLTHRAYILADQEIGAACLATLPHPGPAPDPEDTAEVLQVRVGSSVADVEQRLIFATLEQVAGNKQKAAEVLGVSLKTLYNRLSAYKAE